MPNEHPDTHNKSIAKHHYCTATLQHTATHTATHIVKHTTTHMTQAIDANERPDTHNVSCQ